MKEIITEKLWSTSRETFFISFYSHSLSFTISRFFAVSWSEQNCDLQSNELKQMQNEMTSDENNLRE